MNDESARIDAVAQALREAFGAPPPTAVTLGSGLGPVVERAVVERRVPTPELGLPASTVPGHAGEAVLGTLGGARVLLLSGRVHAYEGYSFAEVVRYVRALRRWGVRRILLTCSAGALRRDLPPGTLTVLRDHLNLMPGNPLIGPVIEGERFPDAAHAHDPGLRRALIAAAEAAGVPLPEAVYAGLIGPAYETAAEVRMLGLLGADLVGMSTVPEVLAAARIGLPVAAVAVVSNYGAGVGDEAVDHASVTAVAGRAAVALADVFERAIPAFDA
jgi:inosine/guanosine/xanthosine phosphorylase family protein